MNRPTPSEREWAIEPERYELYASPVHRFELDRREFFKTLGCGILVLLVAHRGVTAESGRRGRYAGDYDRSEIAAWLHVGEDGIVTVFTGKAEVGQNIRTSLAQAVAEELPVPFSSIRLTMADTELTPYDRGTFGSRTTPDMASQLHRAAAAARHVLLDLAAETFNTDHASLTVAEGKIVRNETHESRSFGELTQGKRLTQSIADEPPVTPATEWDVAGKSRPKVDGRAFVTGSHRYTSDLKRPNLVYGKVLRPIAFGAKLESVDTGAAEALPGVKVVRDGDFIGVTAPDEQTAARAVEAIQAEWSQDPPRTDSEELYTYLKANPSDRDGWRGSRSDENGDLEEGLAEADHRLEQSYRIAYIAHAPMEPRAAVAEWDDNRLTVWTGSQRPFGVQSELAEAFNLPEEQVRVIVPDTGSAYGGKHTGEAAVEAARLARHAGRPVKLVWTREEEFTWAYFRPAGLIEVRSGVRRDGTLTAWEFHNYNSGASAIQPPYRIPNQRTEFHYVDSPLREGSYRALAATANHFARETHLDEQARELGMDPLELRLKNLDDDRLRTVLKTAADRFGWREADPKADHGVGISGGFEKGSYIATCAEVAVDRQRGTVRVVRVTAAFECGAIVNPDHLKNQVEGCLIMGLGGALFEEITFKEGRIRNPRFSQYRVPRFRDAPEIQVALVDRKDLPSAGAGETPIVGIAPAVGNAIFDATGIRLRSMPLTPKGSDALKRA